MLEIRNDRRNHKRKCAHCSHPTSSPATIALETAAGGGFGLGELGRGEFEPWVNRRGTADVRGTIQA